MLTVAASHHRVRRIQDSPWNLCFHAKHSPIPKEWVVPSTSDQAPGFFEPQDGAGIRMVRVLDLIITRRGFVVTEISRRQRRLHTCILMMQEMP
jgi:hypothetical protein